MRIQTRQQAEAFQKAIDACKMPVWLTSVKGEKYNLKKDCDRYMGIARLMQDEKDELELFASSHRDEMILMEFYVRNCVRA